MEFEWNKKYTGLDGTALSDIKQKWKRRIKMRLQSDGSK